MSKKSGYNRCNFLKRVQRVNEVFIEHNKRGVFAENIYKLYVAEQFLISKRTFYNYLTIPYARQLEELEKKEEKRQLQLIFNND